MALLTGGGWTIFQTQFTAQNAQIYENRQIIDKTAALIQAQIDRRAADMDRDIKGIKATEVTQAEFKQFEASIFGQIDTLRRQLSIIETTRPTTGELQAANKNAVDTTARLEDRVRYLEQYLLGQNKIFGSQPK